MANTTIQLKYSSLNSTPASLNVGEPAYSFVSDKLFVGNTTNGVLTIGGKKYVDQLEANTSTATPNTLVVRDANGSVSFNEVTANFINATISGNAESASKLQTARNIALIGDVVGSALFDGTSNISINAELSDTGVSPGTYGGTTAIPVITVDVDGRVTGLSNAAISTNLGIAGDAGSDSISLSSDTLTFVGKNGISTSVVSTNNSVLFSVDNTVIRTTGNQTITGNFTITGNLVVAGNTIRQNVEQVFINDPLLYLAANNYSADALDIGWAGNYFDGVNQRHTGMIRVHGTNEMYLFTNYLPEFDNNLLNVSDPSLRLANTHTNITGGRVFALSQPVAIADGGTGSSSFTAGQIVVGNGVSGLQTIANTGTAGTYGSASIVPVFATDVYGRVSSVTNTAIAIDSSQITSGTLGISRGGTNQTSFTTGRRVVFDGTSLSSQANAATTVTGSLSSANTITSLSINAYGEITALTAGAISIDMSQVTSGNLSVARGGTGSSSFTVKGVIVSDSSSTTGALTSLTSSTEGHVLQINSSGVPSFAHLNGGTF